MLVVANEADFEKDGVSAHQDMRYDVVFDYLRLSSSYEAVRSKLLDKPTSLALPVDFEVVANVVRDFGGLEKIQEAEWWNKIGKKLYGISAPLPVVSVNGELSETRRNIESRWGGYNSVVVQLPLSQTLNQTMTDLKRKLSAFNFAASLPESIQPKYKLLPSKLRIVPLLQGVMALRRYRTGTPLWKIGNQLRLIPGQSFDEALIDKYHPDDISYQKEVLSIAARRLIKKAALISENAARGRFPCDKPFPEAILYPYERKAGRPKGSLSAKRKHAG